MKNYKKQIHEKEILGERLKYFMHEVIPVELLPFLSSLQQIDREAVEASQRNEGPTRANHILVDKLKRRPKGFQNFVQALRKCGYEHTALLLDPYYNYPVDAEDDEAADTDGSGVGFKKIGTAIDVTIKGNLLPQNSAEQTEACSELETYLARKFKDHSSPESKNMRKELQKHLPQGAVFVNTAKGSIFATFRLSSEQAAKKLWEMYTKGKFQTTLQTVLVENTLKEDQKVPEKPLELKLSLGEDRFNQIQKKLAEIESKQEVADSLLTSTLAREQEGSTRDDGSVPERKIDIPPVFLGSNANSFGRCELELREYQKELAAPAIEGKNTIICAPTNSGKTYVAIEIAKQHLDAGNVAGGDSRKDPKVVFIVSTVNLVLQQKDRFEDFLGDKYSVGEISGANSTEIPLKYLLQKHEVVVMTAQILVNALNSKNMEERVELSDISLLLFDECHHADKEHSYNRIMERYLALKTQAGKQHSLPQVVGFTASLGTGKAQSVEKAEQHILLVSANLDAEVISTVKKNKEELKMYANIPKMEIFHVPKTSQDQFEKIVSKVMDKIEALIQNVRGKSYKAGPPDKAGQQYRQWVEELYKESIANGGRLLVTFTEQLREYHVALTINASTTMKKAKNRLQRYFESLNEDKFQPIDGELKTLFQSAMSMLEKFVEENGEPENPLLMYLKQLLLKNYEDVEPQQERNGKKEDDEANKVTQNENVTEEKNLKNEKDAMTLNGDESSGREDLSEKNDAESADCTSNDQVIVEGDVACDGGANKTAGGTDEVEKGKAKSYEHNKEADRDEDNTSNSAQTTHEDKPSDDRNGDKKEWKGPKGILFTRTRESTEALLDWIKETKELNAVLRPEPLVGSGDSNIGMTQHEQEQVIKRFHTGEKNLLLATSVAEEGLDIMDCNYVIRYDMMGNEISTVQSRGRVRADEGKYSVLVGQDSGALKREHTSCFRENLMIKALSQVQNMDPEKFTEQVKAIQRKTFLDRSLKKQVTANLKSAHLDDDVTFRCRKCNVEACQAHEIRTINTSYHVVINSDFKDSKVDMGKHPKPKTIDGIVMNEKIYCKMCHEDWGVAALISGVEWMCIKIGSFVLEFPDPNPERRTYKKWKELPFRIKEATVNELLQQAKNGAQDDFHFDLDQSS